MISRALPHFVHNFPVPNQTSFLVLSLAFISTMSDNGVAFFDANPKFIEAVTSFRKLESREERQRAAQLIQSTYLLATSPKFVTLDKNVAEAITRGLAEALPTLFDLARSEIDARLQDPSATLSSRTYVNSNAI